MKKIPLLLLTTTSLLTGCTNQVSLYQIRWLTEDGSKVLRIDEYNDIGAMPDPDTSITSQNYLFRTLNQTYTYEIESTEPEIERVTKNQDYKVKYKRTSNYTLNFKIKTDVEKTTLTIPTAQEKEGAIKVNWGDGSNEDSSSSHTYKTADDYDVTVSFESYHVTSFAFKKESADYNKDITFSITSFPASLVSIENYAFKGVTLSSGAADLTACKNLTKIGDNAFEGCTPIIAMINVKKVITLSKKIFGENIPGTIVVPKNLEESYKKTYPNTGENPYPYTFSGYETVA